ncbi:Crp/Fnr family transcriptional regulator [uncultured Tenacibaculum sp.]|uniref:Crp/Fnr family transcriptional regulator n=1 Tax=uncultured Tenacibaculum sp. TaxID=174713 RepID=UPI00260D6CA4|nr:Crp/Fnr family transcriptional regulator [uncultured Tenacibaculum sp.]
MSLKIYLKEIINDESLDIHINEIVDAFEEKTLSKNELFVKEGAICDYFCFIESGILQHYITIDGEEKTTYLALKNTCTSALKSFLHQKSSRKNIKALSEVNLQVLSIQQFNHLLKNNKAFFLFYYKLIENQIFLIDDYRINLLTLSPEDRYQKLLANDPELLKSIPLHYLASFLGISKRHMSRIRKKVK